MLIKVILDTKSTATEPRGPPRDTAAGLPPACALRAFAVLVLNLPVFLSRKVENTYKAVHSFIIILKSIEALPQRVLNAAFCQEVLHSFVGCLLQLCLCACLRVLCLFQLCLCACLRVLCLPCRQSSLRSHHAVLKANTCFSGGTVWHFEILSRRFWYPTQSMRKGSCRVPTKTAHTEPD